MYFKNRSPQLNVINKYLDGEKENLKLRQSQNLNFITKKKGDVRARKKNKKIKEKVCQKSFSFQDYTVYFI